MADLMKLLTFIRTSKIQERWERITSKTGGLLGIAQTKIREARSNTHNEVQWYKLTFDPPKQKLPDFLEKKEETAGKIFKAPNKANGRDVVYANIMYAKLPPHFKILLKNVFEE